MVASFTDAWIETCIICRKRKANAVASFTDAWIETNIDTNWQAMEVSHLLQMRGLKRSREQYLKTRVEVASFTDAWIETEINDINEHVNLRRIFYRCVD